MGRYERVLPRDLFNEAKLLKCLGRLCLLIHNELCSLTMEHDDSVCRGFDIRQDAAEGSLYCSNLHFFTPKKRRILVYSFYNSHEEYPLGHTDDRTHEECEVFTPQGKLTEEFLAAIQDVQVRV